MPELAEVSISEIAEALSVTRQAAWKRAKSQKWKNRKTSNKRGDRRFWLEGLPEDVRAAVMRARQEKTANSSYIEVAKSMPRVSAAYRRPIPVGSPELSDWQNRIALARVDVVEAYLKEKARARSRGEGKVEAATLWIKGFNTGAAYPRLYRILGDLRFSTVEGWCRTWKSSGYDYAALAPKWGGHRRGQRKVTPDEFHQVLTFALHPNQLRKSEAIRLAKRNLERRGVETPSSTDTLRRALDDWVNQHYDRWVFCREGEKALIDKCLPYLDRDAGLLDVGEVFVADGHVLNFLILHPETGKPTRMTDVTWYDWASCYPAGWCIMPTENVVCVAAALRRGILNLGKMPTVAYLDNGKAFKAKLFNDPSIDFEELGVSGMFGRLGIETIFAWPYNAQSKPVERFFETFAEMERLMPTYTGTDIDHKPAHLKRNEQLHKRMHEQRYGGWVPTIEEADQLKTQWVAEYAQRPSRGLKGLCPGDVWEAGRGPGVDEAWLRHLMMATEPKRVDRQGVKLFGRFYYNEALYGLKERVQVKYDIEDLSRVLVYDKTGARQICEAEPIKQVHPVARISGVEQDEAEVKDQIKRKRHLKKETEKEGRAYAAAAPELVVIPSRQKEAPPKKVREAQPMPRAEAEHIEAEASKMKVLELKPKPAEPIYMSEPDRYEEYLRREFHGEELTLDEMAFMRYFEKTGLYQDLRQRYEMLLEVWTMEQEDVEEAPLYD